MVYFDVNLTNRSTTHISKSLDHDVFVETLLRVFYITVSSTVSSKVGKKQQVLDI